MADTKISAMTAAVSVADADLVPVVQGGANKRATAAMIRAGLVSELTARTANTILAGPTTGAAAAATFRALVAADIPSLSYQPVDATLTALAALGAGPGFLQVTGQDTFSIAALTGAQVNTALAYTAANAAALNASNLTTGTIPDARFPAVLPAISGANLTNLPGGISGLTAGVIPVATSGTAIGNSKLSIVGGVATLYDDTGGGVSQIAVREGSGQGAVPAFVVKDASGNVQAGLIGAALGGGFFVGAAPYSGVVVSRDGLTVPNGYQMEANGAAPWTIAGVTLRWPSGTSTVGLAYSASGILKVTDGTTGYGRLLAGTLGVNNSAAGSTPGTCVKKVEIFDAAGASLGFVPVYDAIT